MKSMIRRLGLFLQRWLQMPACRFLSTFPKERYNMPSKLTKTHFALKLCRLSVNKIGDEGAKAIVASLEKNTTLIELEYVYKV